MDMHPTPFPATKSQSVRSKYKSAAEAPKINPKSLLPTGKIITNSVKFHSCQFLLYMCLYISHFRQKRVFGTIRNPNVPTKPNSVPEKPTNKPSVPRKQSKLVQNPEIAETPVTDILPVETIQPADILSIPAAEISVIQPESTQTKEIQSIPVVDISVVPLKESKSIQATEKTPVPSKKYPAENRARTKKKSVCFPEPTVREKSSKKLQDLRETDGIPQTPVRSPFSLAKPRLSGTPFSLAKPRLSGTPYQSAEKCSHCRFDRLETSSYWLSQIRLAESVGKHFVSLAFFGLALDSKAEPYRSLRVELKRYLGRHEHLSSETEWKDVSRKYGLLKDESKQVDVDSGSEKVVASDTSTGDNRDQEEQNKEPNEEQNDQLKEEAATSQSHEGNN